MYVLVGFNLSSPGSSSSVAHSKWKKHQMVWTRCFHTLCCEDLLSGDPHPVIYVLLKWTWTIPNHGR